MKLPWVLKCKKLNCWIEIFLSSLFYLLRYFFLQSPLIYSDSVEQCSGHKHWMESIVVSMSALEGQMSPLSLMIQKLPILLRRKFFVAGKACRSSFFLSSWRAFFSNCLSWICIHSNLFGIRLNNHHRRGFLSLLPLMKLHTWPWDKMGYCRWGVGFHPALQHLKVDHYCHGHQQL